MGLVPDGVDATRPPATEPRRYTPPWSLHARRETRDDHRPRLLRAEPRLRPLPRPAADALGARRCRRIRPAGVGRAADHRARVVLHDVEPDARRPRHLRLPQPRRPLLRRPLHRQRRGRQGAAPVGHPRPARQAEHRARRAGHVADQAAQRRHGLVLPDAVAGVAVHLPAGAPQRRSRRSSASTSSTAPSSARRTRTTSCARSTR